jgi:hypothetical protein
MPWEAPLNFVEVFIADPRRFISASGWRGHAIN